MSKPIKLYYDLLSQPSRALYIFMTLAKIPHEKHPISLRKREHTKPDYIQNANKFKKVPCIVDADFQLSESVAIMRYLEREHTIDDHWYPKDLKLRARVDEYMEWQHLNTRTKCALYFLVKWMNPLITFKSPKPEKIVSLQKDMDECLDIIENKWLTEENKFIAGNEITVADIWAACEIEQPIMTGYNPFVGRPKLQAWFELVKKTLDPVYGEAHRNLYSLTNKNRWSVYFTMFTKSL